MSSIPLAIKPPEAPVNPLDQYAKAQGIVSMMQEQKLRQQQTEQNQISLNDQKAASEAMKNWDGQSLDDLPGLYIKHGASANSVLKLKQDVLDFTSKKTTQQKAQLENDKLMHDNMAGGLDAIASLPVGSQPDALEKFKGSPDVIQGLSPDQRAQFVQSVDGLKARAQGGEDISADLQRLKNEHLAESQITKNAMDQQDVLTKKNANEETTNKLAALKAWQAKPENAGKSSADFDVEQAGAKSGAEESAKLKAEQDAMGGGAPNQAMADAQYRALQFKKLRGQTLTKDEEASVGAYEKQKNLGAQFQFNLQNGGLTGQNGQPSVIAKGLADGSMKWQDVVSVRTPMAVKQQLLAEVKSIKPDYNSGDFAVEQKVKEEATSGSVGKQLLAIGTAREHMKLFGQLADALNNGNVQILNKIGNSLGIQFGSDKATNLKIAAQAFGGEVGRAFDGAGVVAGERADAKAAYEDYLSKGQFKGAVDTVDALLAGKQKAAHAWFDQGTKAKPDFGNENPTGQSTGQGKTLSQAAVAKAAKDHGVSVDEATKQAKAAGYTIQ